MFKLVSSTLIYLLFDGCAIGTPRITRGNSSSVEVWAGHVIDSRHLADPIADQ